MAARLQKDWRPNQDSIKWIESHGLTLKQAEPAILEFTNYWLQRTTRRKDWNLSFRRNGVVQGSLIRIAGNLKRYNKPSPHREYTPLPKESREEALAAQEKLNNMMTEEQRESARKMEARLRGQLL
jgi:hypothetical protein